MSGTGQARTAPGQGVISKIWAAAALMALVFVAALALVADRASRVADEFSLDAERRMAVLELQRQADEAVRQVNDVANWDDMVEAVSKRDKADMKFVEDEVSGWLTDELDFSFAAALDEQGVARFATVDGSLMSQIGGLRQAAENADLVNLARQRYEERRVEAEEGYFVPYDNGANTITKQYYLKQPTNINVFNVSILDEYENYIQLEGGNISLTLEVTEVLHASLYETMRS